MEVIIAYRRDTAEREANFKRVCAMWASYGMVPYICGAGDDKPWFHRTAHFNTAMEKVQSDIIVFADADVMVDFSAVAEAAQLVQRGAVMAYPHRQIMYNVPADWHHGNIELWKQYQGRFKQFQGRFGFSVGGMFVVNRTAYMDCGGENEAIIGWGCDDFERYDRISTLCGTIPRANGVLWHLEHPHVEDRRHAKQNQALCSTLAAGGYENVRKNIETWAWRQRWVKQGVILP